MPHLRDGAGALQCAVHLHVVSCSSRHGVRGLPLRRTCAPHAQASPISLSFFKNNIMRLPLLALAAAAFGIGTTEFVIMGLLPDVAADLGVSAPAAGMLVSGYAIGVAVGAPILAILTNKWPRKTALVGLMGLFILGNAL